MKAFGLYAASPITVLARLSERLGIDIRVKRDDLLPMTGGGNKVRKNARIVATAERLQCDWLVTCGGSQSNHARVVALLAAGRGWGCSLILHGNPSDLDHPTGNLLLSMLAGPDIAIVAPDQIAGSMARAMSAAAENGHKPYEICGGGHCLDGSIAYCEAVDELSAQCDASGWRPDWIVVASGTGTTQAGLIIGVLRHGWDTRVVGISVARPNPRGGRAVHSSCGELAAHYGMEHPGDMMIDFRDDWICGGYEQADARVLSTIRTAASSDGLILDPTYTGKAFAGLLDMVSSGEIKRGDKVLFWHTGGLLNLLSAKHQLQPDPTVGLAKPVEEN